MAIQIEQAIAVGKYLFMQRLMGRKKFPLVLMLEPLFRCNLACSGCGKIQHPKEILKQNLSPEDCFKAVEECGAPVVSIPGGEPLLHPQIDQIVEGLVARKKFIYLCTNGILLEKSLDKFLFTFMHIKMKSYCYHCFQSWLCCLYFHICKILPQKKMLQCATYEYSSLLHIYPLYYSTS